MNKIAYFALRFSLFIIATLTIFNGTAYALEAPVSTGGLLSFGPQSVSALVDANAEDRPNTVAGCPSGAIFNFLTGEKCNVEKVTFGCPVGAIYNFMTGSRCEKSVVSTPPSSIIIKNPVIEGDNFCYVFNRNLRIGDTGADVEKLNSVLGEAVQSYSLRFSSQSGIFFDEMMASAVSEFQEKYALEILKPYGLMRGTGYVGPSTRAKLNQLYKCAVEKPPVSKVSIDQETLTSFSRLPTLKGSAYNVVQPFGITLSSESGDKVWGSGNISVNNNRWSVKIGQSLAVGSYQVHVYSNNDLLVSETLLIDSKQSDTSTDIETETMSTPVNGAPKIVGIPAIQTDIEAGKEINISMSATDPDNDDLMWSVDWDLGDDIDVGSSCSITRRQTGTGWSYNASHAWPQAGTYQVKVNVSDCVGGSDTYLFTVDITEEDNTIQMMPGNDYYFKGPATLEQIKEAGFLASDSQFKRTMELFTFSGDGIPEASDIVSTYYYMDFSLRAQGYVPPVGWSSGWWQHGTGPTVYDPSTQTSNYFIIRKTGKQNSGAVFTIPDGVTYFGDTPMNGQPRPWTQ
ncbi:MAG: hypothetical protein A3G52_04150 [Candidatus Taylorbacteria bacterium RIFCSPLOWO2_12_FULL_43_20]|uniref:PKD domain-containing protein n=1 Tax=Candidatus Taylorbacteria bacterium RIFCSPLOWO2_12_FULL_43_20 TaxID=1802332 RepID=A0A1G2P0R5_9BACT|nr:MAG: hypothetical protein A2825_00350 [Candidatus Taylorbacteria bacterium RIFCSPHIGHO2_01_FULL_43_120]OHA22580.1 MAG: hypothetical protein A3B98_02710 [Candidatus Taylorbacteria bacterium RIFCSPHIGHO2_02_FULL_43_55]OHA28614.1 MAG: hypothetical protein A3E92_01585 [Candidatus Taylorbacteria bacterium RIFCSPHIGHO2_12_FULL_42_34]OHA30528.1 MAG: hypothetical protein A3B09_00225 [Candidatus Taylorbacteria bacterium RIFCSPLOWO2_01_FULL_43_83]OHA38115.1 MAG: hypothetical protein A3H58_01040 [Candi